MAPCRRRLANLESPPLTEFVTADPATHDASIASLGLLAEITTSADVLEALSVTAKHETVNA